ncbi:hypothetical protein AVEN_215164-1 [Araneus ventricosus]|uniref:BED-type domain-containing protein n=1 Tax=Araneus ventricosus TaxID=182803 RepID=A0A4Y2FNH3_ARAVE|nr:hypothetical protein AVEN_215164-1 [Araneus ventricosus]
MPGKCMFNPLWVVKEEYADWLRSTENKNKAKCIWCAKEIDISNMGEAALKTHMKGVKHASFKKGKITVAANVADFFKKSTVSPSSPKSANQNSIIDPAAARQDVLDAEILWCLKLVKSHFSYNSCNNVGKLFSKMFHDSIIARQFSLSERKAAYICHFGIAPYFQNQVYEDLKQLSHFTVLFDETLNKTNQQKQLDLHIRYWSKDNRVTTRYLTSIFMGHATASNILDAFKIALAKLDLKKLVQISMDGPSVNWCFYEHFQEDLKKEHDIKCINIGSCGIHILNNAFQKGASSTEWDISSVLVALYHLFKDSPARSEDFQECSKSEKMPLKFANHRWLENAPVSLRAVEIWEDIETYVKLIRNGKLPKVTCKSYKVVEEATKGKLIKIKLLFFACVSEVIKSFLEKYQSDEPLVPFFAPDIHRLAI